MNYEALEQQARARFLTLRGGLHPKEQDSPHVAPGTRTILLLGPDEPGFWSHFRSSPEYQDGLADPMDRWSLRVISQWAKELGAQPLFPFVGPNFKPFFRWALNSGQAFPSPVSLLVHAEAGLFISYRGALALPWQIELPASVPAPCAACADQPCQSACPVGALNITGYDVPACKRDLDRLGNDCMTRGCAVRRSCPQSQQHPRPEPQSAFHMRDFK